MDLNSIWKLSLFLQMRSNGYQIRETENEENIVKRPPVKYLLYMIFFPQCLFLHFLSAMPLFINCTSSKSCMSPKVCGWYPAEKEAAFIKNCTPPGKWKLNLKLVDAFLYENFCLVNQWRIESKYFWGMYWLECFEFFFFFLLNYKMLDCHSFRIIQLWVISLTSDVFYFMV